MSGWKTFLVSRQANDIVGHLTSYEAAEYHALSRKLGGEFGSRVAGPGAIATVFICDRTAKMLPNVSSLLIFVCIVCVFFLISGLLVRPVYQRLRAFLCSTEYARQKGYEEKSLRVARFGLG
jgi:hypothetical protein